MSALGFSQTGHTQRLRCSSFVDLDSALAVSSATKLNENQD